MAADPDDGALLKLQVEVETAVLYQAYAGAAYGSRDTAGGSMSLDDSFDRLEAAFEQYAEEITRRAREQVLTEIRTALGPANADVIYAQRVMQSPAAGADEWRELHVKRGIAQGLARAIETIEKVEVS